ncbi:MAG: SDR family oxidoreductase [Deltaproteobacteria bacterium]|nr:SDR family oxidoreductase [Deltaproteobacteria bacterium]
MRRVLIAGCGFVGTKLGLELAADADEVWGLSPSPGDLPAEIHPFAADVTKPQTLRDLPASLDLVFFTVAPERHDDEGYAGVYVDGLRNLVDALRAQGQRPRRMLFTSSTAVYAQGDGEWVDETSPAQPQSFSGRRLLEAESLLRASPFPSVVVRLAGIYGPGRGRMVSSVRDGTATCPDGPGVFTNRIHRDDCAGVLRHLATIPDPLPLYLAADNEPADNATVLRWLAEQLDKPAPPTRPAGELRPWERASSKRCRNGRLIASGYRLRFPTFREGYGAILREG